MNTRKSKKRRIGVPVVEPLDRKIILVILPGVRDRLSSLRLESERIELILSTYRKD